MDKVALSVTQWRVMRYIFRSALNGGSVQLAGYGSAPLLSAARALTRKGLAYTYRTGHYGLTDEGKAMAAEWLATLPGREAG